MADAEGHGGHRARMRERLLEGGGEAFLDHELLEYVLGLAIPRRDTKPLSKMLIAEFGGFAGVIAASPAELSRVEGCGEGAAAAIKFIQAAAVRAMRQGAVGRPVLGSWQAVLDYLQADMGHAGKERFRVLFLNGKNVLVKDEVLGEGTVNTAPVYVREILKRALELNAVALILVHNHPSGDPKPSRDDINMTREIVAAGKYFGLSVHDHIVIGSKGQASFKALGLL